MRIIGNCKTSQGAQWLSGRVLSLRDMGCGGSSLTKDTVLCP